MTLRVNRQKNIDNLLCCIKQVGIVGVRSAVVPDAVLLERGSRCAYIASFAEIVRRCNIGSTVVRAALLRCKLEQRVLDACCAPGGKTGHIFRNRAAVGGVGGNR